MTISKISLHKILRIWTILIAHSASLTFSQFYIGFEPSESMLINVNISMNMSLYEAPHEKVLSSVLGMCVQ